MAFDKTELPSWKEGNPDPKPTQTKIDEGFVPGEKPAASMWNWFANRVGRALTDLYDNALHKDQKGFANGVAPLGADNKVPATHLPPSSSTAANVTIADAGNYYTSDKAEGALQEIGQTLNAVRGDLITSVNSVLGA